MTSGAGGADLDGLTERVFGSRYSIRSRSARRERGGRQSTDLVVLSWGSRPRMLLPARGGLAARGLVTARPRLNTTKDAWMRRGLGVALATGLPQRALTAKDQVVAGEDGPADLVAALQAGWDRKLAAVGFSVRPVSPNYKPTFIAVDRRGRVLGFGKVAADPGTRARLGAEVDALTAMADADIADFRTPRVLADLEWSGRRVVVVDPVPATARRFRPRTIAPTHLLRVALERGSTCDVVAEAKALTDAIDLPIGDALRASADAWTGRIERDFGGATSPSGRSHGDLVPWNLAVDGPTVWAWDWEHSAPDEAVATDVVHFHTQVERWVHGRDVATAVELAEPRALHDLRRAGMGAESSRAALALGRLMLVERSAALAQATGMWRPGVHDGLVRLLHTR